MHHKNNEAKIRYVALSLLILLPIIVYIRDCVEDTERTIPDTTIVRNEQIPYYRTKLLNNVKVERMTEIPFNRTYFVCRYSAELGLSTDEIQFASLSGSIAAIPITDVDQQFKYLHLSRIIEMPCEDPYLPDGTYKGWCFQGPIRSFAYLELLDKDYHSVGGQYKNREFPQLAEIFDPLLPFIAGPEDGRLIIDPLGNPIISFNMLVDPYHRVQWTFNVTQGSLRQMQLDTSTNIQKNWIPFFKENQLYHVYAWNPVKVLDCRIKYKKCKFTLVNENKEAKDGYYTGQLRGGSALIQYRNYYVGTIRTHYQCSHGRVYRPRLVVLSPEMEVIYISEILDFEGALFVAPFWPSFDYLEKSTWNGKQTLILTSLGLTRDGESDDWVAEFSVHDQKNIVVELKGMTTYLDYIIDSFAGNITSVYAGHDSIEDPDTSEESLESLEMPEEKQSYTDTMEDVLQHVLGENHRLCELVE